MRQLAAIGSRGTVAAVVLAGVLMLATGLARARTQAFGQTLFTHAPNGNAIRFGLPPVYLAQTDATAFEVYPGKHRLNSGTKPFYVGVRVGGFGNNGVAADGAGFGGFYVEFVPPPGVKVLTNNRRYPAYWDSIPKVNGKTRAPVRQPGVLRSGKGNYIGSTLFGMPRGSKSVVFTYQSDKNAVEIFVPVRTTRKLTGIKQPSCAGIHTVSPFLLGPEPLDPATWMVLLSDNFPIPCPPSQAGNDLQVAVHIADEGAPKELVPWVDLITSGPRRHSGPRRRR